MEADDDVDHGVSSHRVQRVMRHEAEHLTVTLTRGLVEGCIGHLHTLKSGRREGLLDSRRSAASAGDHGQVEKCLSQMVVATLLNSRTCNCPATCMGSYRMDSVVRSSRAQLPT